MALPVFCPAGSRGGYQPHGAPPPLRGTHPPPPHARGYQQQGGWCVCVCGGDTAPQLGGRGSPLAVGLGGAPRPPPPLWGAEGPPLPRGQCFLPLPFPPPPPRALPLPSPPPPAGGWVLLRGPRRPGTPRRPPQRGLSLPLAPAAMSGEGGGPRRIPGGSCHSLTHPPTHPRAWGACRAPSPGARLLPHAGAGGPGVGIGGIPVLGGGGGSPGPAGGHGGPQRGHDQAPDHVAGRRSQSGGAAGRRGGDVTAEGGWVGRGSDPFRGARAAAVSRLPLRPRSVAVSRPPGAISSSPPGSSWGAGAVSSRPPPQAVFRPRPSPGSAPPRAPPPRAA